MNEEMARNQTAPGRDAGNRPVCIYLVGGKSCGKPATHYLVRAGRPRHFYCELHAGFVRSAIHGRIVEPL